MRTLALDSRRCFIVRRGINYRGPRASPALTSFAKVENARLPCLPPFFLLTLGSPPPPPQPTSPKTFRILF
jgi:hypothetical protein